ncbi:MAG TPA: TerC/Alx family metal homeostasis membrane protein, partial [Nitrososphaera sp.]|nr:TerC/Alx family metal homeostasis membrane protein [Nitrososphaera sp.]
MAVDLGALGMLRSRRLRSKEPSTGKEKQEKEKRGSGSSTFRQALAWTIVWISLAVVFAGIIYTTSGYSGFLEFVTGYALEKSLSVDNMFVFIIVFSSLGIPHQYQHRVLSVGIISAIAMRIPLIIAGASLLENFHWMMYVFGAFLVVTAVRMAIQRKETEKIDIERNVAVRLLKKFIPLTPQLHENKFLVRLAGGALYATPLLVALVIVEMTDLVFAIDSIPAVLAITTDPFIVITSNVFAILGLRSLYFLLAGMMERFYYLKPALVALLMFIGAKMLVSEVFKIPVEISLAVIFAILGIALGLSALK